MNIQHVYCTLWINLELREILINYSFFFIKKTLSLIGNPKLTQTDSKALKMDMIFLITLVERCNAIAIFMYYLIKQFHMKLYYYCSSVKSSYSTVYSTNSSYLIALFKLNVAMHCNLVNYDIKNVCWPWSVSVFRC